MTLLAVLTPTGAITGFLLAAVALDNAGVEAGALGYVLAVASTVCLGALGVLLALRISAATAPKASTTATKTGSAPTQGARRAAGQRGPNRRPHVPADSPPGDGRFARGTSDAVLLPALTVGQQIREVTGQLLTFVAGVILLLGAFLSANALAFSRFHGTSFIWIIALIVVCAGGLLSEVGGLLRVRRKPRRTARCVVGILVVGGLVAVVLDLYVFPNRANEWRVLRARGEDLGQVYSNLYWSIHARPQDRRARWEDFRRGIFALMRGESVAGPAARQSNQALMRGESVAGPAARQSNQTGSGRFVEHAPADSQIRARVERGKALYANAESALEREDYAGAMRSLEAAIAQDPFPAYEAALAFARLGATQPTPSQRILGSVEEIAATLGQHPDVQQSIVAEAIRFMETSFTGYTLPLGERGIGSVLRFEAGPVRSTGRDLVANVKIHADLHYAHGLHAKARVIVPVRLHVAMDLASKQSGGSRRRLICTAITAEPISLQALEVTPHPDGDATTPVREIANVLRSAGFLDGVKTSIDAKLANGAALFWEMNRGSAFLMSARAPDGQLYRADDIDNTEVVEARNQRNLRYVSKDAGAIAQFKLRVVGGSVKYHYPFSAGQLPFVSLDRNLLIAVKNITKPGVPAPTTNSSPRLRFSVHVDKGEVLVAVSTGLQPRMILDWTPATAQSPFQVDLSVAPGPVALHMMNRATRVFDEWSAPTASVAIQELNPGLTADPSWLNGQWLAAAYDAQGQLVEAEVAFVAGSRKRFSMRSFTEGRETQRIAGFWSITPDGSLLLAGNQSGDEVRIPYALAGTFLRLRFNGMDFVFNRFR